MQARHGYPPVAASHFLDSASYYVYVTYMAQPLWKGRTWEAQSNTFWRVQTLRKRKILESKDDRMGKVLGEYNKHRTFDKEDNDG